MKATLASESSINLNSLDQQVLIDWQNFYKIRQRHKNWPFKQIKRKIKEGGICYLNSLLLIIKEQKENKVECKKLLLRINKWLELRRSWLEFQKLRLPPPKIVK